MSPWIYFDRIWPVITGSPLHVVNIAVEPLEAKLIELGFKTYIIDGTNIVDEKTFFNEVAQVLEFPSYFGHGWAGWDDCLGDFGHLAPERTAVVWKNGDKSFAADAQVFLKAVCDLNGLATNAALGLLSQDKKRKQIEVFITK